MNIVEPLIETNLLLKFGLVEFPNEAVPIELRPVKTLYLTELKEAFIWKGVAKVVELGILVWKLIDPSLLNLMIELPWDDWKLIMYIVS